MKKIRSAWVEITVLAVGIVLVILMFTSCGGDGKSILLPCDQDSDKDHGCGNDRPDGSLDCDDRPPCNPLALPPIVPED